MAKNTIARRIQISPGTTQEEVKLLQRAAADKEGNRGAVRRLLASRPALVTALSATATELEDDLIDGAGGKGVLVHESMRAEFEHMRASPRLPHDRPLEDLLIAQVALFWLNLTTAERLRAERWREGVSWQAADFWDRQVARLRTDYLRAIRSLASVRRVLVSAIQVNIAGQQVNQVAPFQKR